MKKRILACILAIALALPMVAVSALAETTAADLPPVKLTYYFPNSAQPGLPAVNEALDKLLTEKINATVELDLIDWGTFDQKMNAMMASGESYDLCFTSTWANNFYQGVSKGAFLPLDDLLAKYAPEALKSIPPIFLDVAKVGGKLYAIPNFQQATAGFGYLIQKPVADADKIDWKSIKKLEELTPVLAAVKASHPDLVTYGASKKNEFFKSAATYFGFDDLGDDLMPGRIRLDDAGMKVINQYESPEFVNFVKLMHEWYTAGYLRPDVATMEDMTSDLKAGKVAVTFGQIDIDTPTYEQAGMAFAGRLSNYSGDIVQSYDMMWSKPVLTTGKAAATLTAISATCKNPERAMMLINLLNTDKDVYNMVNFGVEGVNYTKNNDVRITTNKDGGYQLFSQWEFGNMENAYLTESDPQGDAADKSFIKMWSDLNRNATPSPALGFAFIPDNVKTQIANCQSVIDQYYFAIALGSVDPDQYLPEFTAKLKAAGMDDIIAEKQAQLDAWKAANGK